MFQWSLTPEQFPRDDDPLAGFGGAAGPAAPAPSWGGFSFSLGALDEPRLGGMDGSGDPSAWAQGLFRQEAEHRAAWTAEVGALDAVAAFNEGLHGRTDYAAFVPEAKSLWERLRADKLDALPFAAKERLAPALDRLQDLHQIEVEKAARQRQVEAGKDELWSQLIRLTDRIAATEAPERQQALQALGQRGLDLGLATGLYGKAERDGWADALNERQAAAGEARTAETLKAAIAEDPQAALDRIDAAALPDAARTGLRLEAQRGAALREAQADAAAQQADADRAARGDAAIAALLSGKMPDDPTTLLADLDGDPRLDEVKGWVEARFWGGGDVMLLAPRELRRRVAAAQAEGAAGVPAEQLAQLASAAEQRLGTDAQGYARDLGLVPQREPDFASAADARAGAADARLVAARFGREIEVLPYAQQQLSRFAALFGKAAPEERLAICRAQAEGLGSFLVPVAERIARRQPAAAVGCIVYGRDPALAEEIIALDQAPATGAREIPDDLGTGLRPQMLRGAVAAVLDLQPASGPLGPALRQSQADAVLALAHSRTGAAGFGIAGADAAREAARDMAGSDLAATQLPVAIEILHGAPAHGFAEDAKRSLWERIQAGELPGVILAKAPKAGRQPGEILEVPWMPGMPGFGGGGGGLPVLPRPDQGEPSDFANPNKRPRVPVPPPLPGGSDRPASEPPSGPTDVPPEVQSPPGWFDTLWDKLKEQFSPAANPAGPGVPSEMETPEVPVPAGPSEAGGTAPEVVQPDDPAAPSPQATVPQPGQGDPAVVPPGPTDTPPVTPSVRGPQGGTRLPDGSIQRPDGTRVMPDGTLAPPATAQPTDVPGHQPSPLGPIGRPDEGRGGTKPATMAADGPGKLRNPTSNPIANEVAESHGPTKHHADLAKRGLGSRDAIARHVDAVTKRADLEHMIEGHAGRKAW